MLTLSKWWLESGGLYSVGWVSLQGHNNVASLALRGQNLHFSHMWLAFAAVAYVLNFAQISLISDSHLAAT